jgi:hypothetical protein
MSIHLSLSIRVYICVYVYRRSWAAISCSLYMRIYDYTAIFEYTSIYVCMYVGAAGQGDAGLAGCGDNTNNGGSR